MVSSSQKLTRQEKSWILYDVANSAFVLIVITTLFPIFFKDYAAAGLAKNIASSYFLDSIWIVALIIAILAPILGTFADYKNNKKRFLITFLLLGIISTFLLFFVKEGAWLSCLILAMIGRLGFGGSNIFYDSLLVDVTTNEKMDKVSSHGYAWGYIGSVVPFIFALLLTQKPDWFGLSSGWMGAKVAFLITAIWWLLFSIPILRNVKQKYYIEAQKRTVFDGFKRLLITLKKIKSQKTILLFLIAYFFYIDGVDTIIGTASFYGRSVGIKSSSLILLILAIQVVAFPFALLFGKLAKKYSEKKMILSGIGIYVIISIVGFFIPAFETIQMRTVLFWVLGMLVAVAQGGIQALSRSFYGKIIPKEQSAEYFGFYNIFGKFAMILGPFLMRVIGSAAGHLRYGILSLIVLFVLGGAILLKTKIEPN